MSRKLALVAVLAMCITGAGLAADFDKLPDTMKNAVAGQWVRYSVIGGLTQRHTITALEGKGEEARVTVQTETFQDGKNVDTETQKMPLGAYRDMQVSALLEDPDTRITDVKIPVGGREYDAVLIEYTNPNYDQPTKIWMSEKVPVTGILRMTVGDEAEPILELIDFGD